MKKNHGIQLIQLQLMVDLMMAVGIRISTMMANGNLMITRDQMKMVNTYPQFVQKLKLYMKLHLNSY